MQIRYPQFVSAVLISMAMEAHGATRYVNLNNPGPAFPYTSWATAATDIQTAVDVSASGDLILVTNGVYAAGGRSVISGDTSNRVAMSTAMTVRSVNGPNVTVIQGGFALRGAYLWDGAVLSGFTVSGGNITNSSAGTSEQGNNGAGVWCRSSASIVTNCVLADNYARLGAGAYRGKLVDCVLTNCGIGGAACSNILVNCRLINNRASGIIFPPHPPPAGASYSSLTNCVLTGNTGSYEGGAAYFSTLTGCLISSNSAFNGGGAFQSILNTILHNNTALSDGGATYFGTLNNCIVASNTANYFGASYSNTLINCVVFRNSGNSGAVVDGTLNNCTVVSNLSVGVASATLYNCIVYYNGAPGPLNYSGSCFLNYCCTTPLPGGGSLGNFTNAPLFVDVASGDLHLQNSSPCINSGNNAASPNPTDIEGHPRIVGGKVDIGAYEFQPPLFHYVNLNSATPASPYTSWASAATNIQDAVDVSANDDVVLVTNGFYAVGGRAFYPSGTNRVTVTNRLTLLSVNGPSVTTIAGLHASGTNAVRCVGMSTNSVLSGFTLTNGQSGSSGLPGGGVYGIPSSVVSNCVLAGNLGYYAGGAYGVRLINCSLIGNTATYGGGASGASLINCLVISNTAAVSGGGTHSSALTNCTVVGNSASEGGGISFGSAINSVIFYNASTTTNHWSALLSFCCTTPLPFSGIGNITNEPAFVDLAALNLHLQSNSPCINSGKNASIATTSDLDGNPRMAGATVDMGAYEFQSPTSVLSYAWLQQYGLPTDGSADYSDTDGDTHNNWQEWRALTDPTSDASVLKMLTVSNDVASTTVQWQSVSGVKYFLQRSGDLGVAPAFATVISNLVGLAGSTSYTDTNAIGDGPFFYRAGVQ